MCCSVTILMIYRAVIKSRHGPSVFRTSGGFVIAVRNNSFIDSK